MRRTVPPHVGHALARALEKLPADRFTSAAEFATALADESFTYKARARTSIVASTSESVVATPVPATMPGPWNRLTIATTTLAALLVALVAWGWLRPSPQRPVTRASVDLGDLSLADGGDIPVSPDGLRFALVGVFGGGGGPLYWRNADEEDFRPIPGTGGTSYASFSPDGESLVFSVAGAGSIQRVALSGGAPQTVTDIPVAALGGIHWGADGTIVFTHTGGLGLYRVPETGGDPQSLLDPTTSVRNARLLPGGRAVIFTDPGALSTLILDLDTDSVRVVRAGAIDAMYVETGHLLYADVSGTLWAVAFDVRRGEVVGDPVTLFDGVSIPAGVQARFAVSQNGTLVHGAGRDAGGGRRLLVVDLEGNVEPLVLAPRNLNRVKWSPDGRSVVYQSRPEGEADLHIYAYDVELGATPRQLTFEGNNIGPVTSSEVRWSYFVGQSEGDLKVDSDGLQSPRGPA